MPISLDKIEAQRKKLIEDQMEKADKAIKKLEFNHKQLVNSIPPALLDQSVGSLLQRTEGDLNVAIHREILRMRKLVQKEQKQKQVPEIIQTQNENKMQVVNKGPQVQVKGMNKKVELSPPKMNGPKRIIKNTKKDMKFSKK